MCVWGMHFKGIYFNLFYEISLQERLLGDPSKYLDFRTQDNLWGYRFEDTKICKCYNYYSFWLVTSFADFKIFVFLKFSVKGFLNYNKKHNICKSIY